MILGPARRTLLPLIAAGALALGGCAGYTIGEGDRLPFRSIHVAPPVNASLAPQTAALLGASLARELDRSGQVAVAGRDSADAELAVTLLELRRDVSADRPDDTGLARKWRVTLVAEITLTDLRSGGVLIDRRAAQAFDEVYADSGHVAAEYQNMPVLTERLAQAVVREVLGVW